jgi:hypothetical protein
MTGTPRLPIVRLAKMRIRLEASMTRLILALGPSLLVATLLPLNAQTRDLSLIF